MKSGYSQTPRFFFPDTFSRRCRFTRRRHAVAIPSFGFAPVTVWLNASDRPALQGAHEVGAAFDEHQGMGF